MPRRSSRAKAEPDANVETRVTRRSLRGAQAESPAKAKATPAKESPAKPAARGRGARSTSRRGRNDAEEEVEEEPTVEPTAESEASEEPEEAVPASPKKGKKSPAPARGRARGRGRSQGRSPRAAGSKADKEDEADKEEDEAAEAVVKDTMSPSRRNRRPLVKTPPKTTPTRSRRSRSSVPEAEAEAPMEEAAAADDKEDKKRKRDDKEESKTEDEEKVVKKQKVDEAPVEDKPADASKEEADTKETEEAMETESAEEVKEDVKMAESKEPTAEAAKVEAKEAAKEKEAPEKEESKTEEPTKAADEDEPMIEEEATKDEAKTETKEDDAKTETKEDEAKTETKEDDADTGAETKEEDAVTKEPEVAAKEPEVAAKEPEVAAKEPEVAAKEPEVAAKEPEVAAKEPEVATKEPEVVTKEPEVATKEPEATKEETSEAAPVEEEMKVDEPETKAEQAAETPSADSSKTKSTEEKMEAAKYAAPDNAEPSEAKDIIKDYVVINMDDVPASDSAEVSQCVPAEKPVSTEESTPNQREENATTDQTTDKISTEVASNGSNTHLSNSTPADTQHHNDTAISNGSDTDSSADPLFSRKFIANPNLAADVDQSKKFTLVSYNILADCHIQQEKYPWMDKGSLLMEARSKRFIQELQYLDADIICLQEVSPDYYNDTLVPTLKASGYEGVFKKRIDPINEGEATFFRLSQFSLVSNRGLALKDIAFKELEACGLDSDKAAAVKAFVDRPAVVLITQLKSNSSGTLLTVGNIHVSYEPITNLDLQCIQAACAVKEVVSMSESPNNAHVICGDFNARPETVLYQLTKEGYLNDTSTTALQAMQNVTMKDDTKQALVNLWWKGFQHTSSSLRSCYSTVNGSEPITARDHTGACKNIDYIWCGGANLDVAGVAATSPEALITAGIPNATFPSDHLSLKAELFFK